LLQLQRSCANLQKPEASKQIADKLRRQADVFTDLTDLQCRVGLDPIEGQTTRLLNLNLISRAELSNGDVEASSASPVRSPRARLGAVSLTENGYDA
jgi:hypothetical protein